MQRMHPVVAHPIESGAADGEARLAAAVLRQAITDAQAGDARALHFATSARRLEPWAAVLRVDPHRLAGLAAQALAPAPRRVRHGAP